MDSMHQPLVLQLMVLTPEDVSKVINFHHFSFSCPFIGLILFIPPSFVAKQVRFGTLTAQSVQVLRLLREAFGVTFKIKQETHVGVSQFASNADNNNKRLRDDEGKSQNKRARHDRESESESENEDSEKDESGSDNEDDDDSENSDQDEDEEDEEGEEGERSDEGSEGSGDDGGEDSESEASEHQISNRSSGRSAAPPVPVPDRTTVLLSCYGVGYSNVFRKAT